MATRKKDLAAIIFEELETSWLRRLAWDEWGHPVLCRLYNAMLITRLIDLIAGNANSFRFVCIVTDNGHIFVFVDVGVMVIFLCSKIDKKVSECNGCVEVVGLLYDGHFLRFIVFIRLTSVSKNFALCFNFFMFIRFDFYRIWSIENINGWF